MVAEIAASAARTGGPGLRRIDADVLAAMRLVPRHRFVPPAVRAFAYQDRALPIGHGATISQPSVVALMTHLLDVEAGMKVLEVGTGSGYQAAILAALGAEVYSIEIVSELAVRARRDLSANGFRVRVRTGDGYEGWPESAPFDRVIVTAGSSHVPRSLLDQLRNGGRMVIPVTEGDGLELQLIRKDRNGKLRSRNLLPVRFVPLVRSPDR